MFVGFVFAVSLITLAQSQQAPVSHFGDWRRLDTAEINAIAISPDGKLVASGGAKIDIRDADTGKIVHSFPRETISILAFSADGSLLATGKFQGELELWDVRTGKSVWPEQTRKVPSHRPNLHLHEPFKPGITALRFVDNDRTLAIETNYPEIRLLDVRQGTSIKSYAARMGQTIPKGYFPEGYSFRSARLSPSGKTMAWLADPEAKGAEKNNDSAVFVFDTVTGAKRSQRTDLKPTRDLARELRLLDDGDSVLIGNEVFGMSDGKKRFAVYVDTEYYPAGEFTAVYQFANVLAVSPDQKSFFTADTTRLKQWDVATGKNLYDGRRVNALAFSADGKRVVRNVGRRLEVADEKLESLREQKQP